MVNTNNNNAPAKRTWHNPVKGDREISFKVVAPNKDGSCFNSVTVAEPDDEGDILDESQEEGERSQNSEAGSESGECPGDSLDSQEPPAESLWKSQ